MGVTYISKRASELELPLVEAKKPLTIEVETKDITGGTMKNPETCAFARATCREVRDVQRAYFLKTTAWLEYPDKIVKYILPISMQKEIVAFDRGLKMTPGVYTMAPPAPSQTAAGIRKVQQRLAQRRLELQKARRLGKAKPKKIRAYHITSGVRGLKAPISVPAK